LGSVTSTKPLTMPKVSQGRARIQTGAIFLPFMRTCGWSARCDTQPCRAKRSAYQFSVGMLRQVTASFAALHITIP
jgi:hypothetical protein